MEAPSKRMRLTVVVEALAEENAHGEYRDMALAAFKERKFAMPVQLEDTFEMVWNDIEQRYKTNYLNAQQAATFSIKKLQDAYDCDLDMTDTVGAIFEGEPDPKMRMIKVIPHFVYRETSVVPGSMLRPTGAQKRVGEDIDDGANKRRRVESQQRQSAHDTRDPSPNRPIPSTESQHAAAVGAEDAEAGRRSTRSRSGMSLVELSRTETGLAPFSSAAVKQESPAPEQSPILTGVGAASLDEPTGRPVESAAEEQPRDGRPRPSRSRTRTSRGQSQEAPFQPTDDLVPEAEEETIGHAQASVQEQAEPPQLDSQETALQKSPVSSVEPEPAPAPVARQRKDVYQVPSSPDFMHKKATPDKPAKTYGRSPRSGADLLNMARRLGRPAEEKSTKPNGTPASITKKARAFQRPQADEIESTPQEEAETTTQKKNHAPSDSEDDDDADLTASFLDEAAAATPNSTQTPARKTAAKPAKPGSLKKPSRASLVCTSASTKRGGKSKAAATPASATSANKPRAKGKAAPPSSVGSSKGEDTLSMLARLDSMTGFQNMLGASQNSTKPQGGASSPARSGSVRSQQSNRSSPEVRIPVTKKTAAPGSNTAAIDARLAIQPPRTQRTPIKSPVSLPSSTRKMTLANSAASNDGAQIPKAEKGEVSKKPAAKVRESPAPAPAAKDAPNATGTPRRSEVPFPPNVRHLRRGSSLQSSPLANGDPDASTSSSAATVKAFAKPKIATPSSAPKSNKTAAEKAAATTSTAKPTNGTIEISSAESSSTDSDPSDSSDSEDDEDGEQAKLGMNGVLDAQSTSAEKVPEQNTGDSNRTDRGETEQPNTLPEHEDLAMHIAGTQIEDKPPSGQESIGAAPWGAQSWGFGSLDQTDNTKALSEQAQEPEPEAVAVAATTSDDEGFAEQDIYSTAVEDNASKSRSASAAASTRSSPAVSRRPARFLSHSPTPDASESEDDADEASAARITSPQVNDKEESESESESSSDSSDDEDVEMPDLPTESTTDTNTKTVPPSSPPLDGLANSTPIVPETSQSTPSQIRRPTHTQRTPIPPPTQQSSQAPRSSQSVSIQAADRRRYTGFRSLREQLADTKAAQATTQKKTFDPRTMSLGKLAKGKPLAGLGGDDDSSDDESSSSSSSDSD